MGRGARATALLLIISVVAVMRLVSLRNLAGPEGLMFSGPDSYDHMRRVRMMLREFPGVPERDNYQGYPEGSPLLLAPLFDYSLAATAKAAGLGSPSERTVDMAGILAPVAYAALSVGAAYLLALEFMGVGGALAAAAVFGFLPAYYVYSLAGQADNNAAEPLLAALYFLHLHRALTGKGRRYLIFAGASGVFAILMWRGATLFWAIGLGAALIAALSSIKDRPGAARVLNAAGTVYVLQGVGLGVMAWGGVLGLKPAMSFREVSYFHAAFSALAGACLLGAWAVLRAVRREGAAASAAAMAAGALAALLLSYAAAPEFWDQVLGALGMMGRGDVWLKDNLEYAPLIKSLGPRGLLDPARALSGFFWLLPIWLVALLVSLARGEKGSVGRALLFALAAGFFVSTLSHMRFQNLLSLGVGLMAGGAFEGFVLQGAGRRRIAFGCVWVALLVPAALETARSLGARHGVLAVQREFFPAMRWIRDNTPPTCCYYDPSRTPEYGVMAEWGLGSWVENVAMRPAVATNFGAETYGLEEASRFFLAGDEDEAASVLEKNRVRYVMATNLIPSLDVYAEIAGLSISGGGYAVLSPEGRWRPGPGYYGLVSTRLLLFDGMDSMAPADGGPPHRALGRFRLLFEGGGELRASGLKQPVKKIKVFEFVRGARLEGRARPGEAVSVSVGILSNQGRHFTYRDEARADELGRFSIVVPYSTQFVSNSTSAVSAYGVSAGGRTANVAVAEDDVIMGRTVTVGAVTMNAR